MTALGIYNVKVFSSLIGDSNASNDSFTDVITNNPPPSITLNNDTSICVGELVTLTATGGVSYSWSNGLNGSSIIVGPNVTTKYIVTVTDGLNCTSIDSVTVTVNDITDTTLISLTTCNPAEAGNFSQTFLNQYGCDSVVKTTITLLPSYSIAQAPLTICEGDSILIFGIQRFENGNYSDTLSTLAGCDSVLTQSLSLIPIDSVSLATITICEDESANIFGNAETSAGIYYSTILASTGCDSVLIQELIVNPLDSVNLGDLSICQGDSIELFGIFQKTADVYYNTILASTGCDSVVYYELNIDPVYTINRNVEICEDDNILLEGALRSTPGIYTDTLQSVSTCDSIVITTLIINLIDSTSETLIVAIGDSVLAEGSYRKVSGDYTDVYQNENNCDSVHITTLTFVPPARYFDYTGNVNFGTSMVFPETGDEYTTFNFEVTYYDTSGVLPPFGFPRMILDYEGNGQYNNNFDRTIIMSELDPADIDPKDGKIYTASINSLIVGMNYKILAQVIEGGEEVIFGPFNNLDVLAEPDLEIFANDIVFSVQNPAVNSPLTVSATVTNTSDYDANNFVVHLVNQYDPAIVYPDIVVPNLAARSSTTVSWNITTPAVDAWCPMEVTVDFTDIILESNELDNVAIRPFINGDYNLPGSIIVHPSITPASQCSRPNNQVRVYGYAYYTGTAVPLADSSVAGATVTITRGAATYSGLTNSNGYFSVYIPAPLVPGTYPTKVEVTDFTLTNDSVTSFDILNCPCVNPDLSAGLSLTDYHILAGQSIGGTATIANVGCDPAIGFQISFTQTGGVPVLVNQNMPALAPGASASYTFNNIVFNIPGTYTICVEADAARTVGETNFRNNRYCRTVRVYPALPDIQPIDGPRINRYLCEVNSVGFRVANNGAVATGNFDCAIFVRKDGVPIDTLYHTIANINAFSHLVFSKAYAYPGVGVYSFNIHCDTTVATGGRVVETTELNNTATYVHEILECKPDLVISGCGNLQVNPYSPTAPGGAVIFEATVRNSGNATAFGPIDIEFEVSGGGPTHTVTIGDLLPGQSLLVQTNAVATASGAAQLTVTADPANAIANEFSEANNSITDNLCWEFKPVPRCTGSDFWARTYNVNETAYLGVAVAVTHLYKADSLHVQFEVSGPGIFGVQNLGNALLTNVSKNCFCPRIAVLPTNFVFNEVGTYTFTMTVDPDNDYPECNDGDNVLIRQVVVNNRPDMRVLSQFINPSLLNPAVNDSVGLVVSYENIGKSNVNDQMELRILIDGVPFDSIKPVVGLVTGDNTSYTIPNRWGSHIPGVHIIRAIIDGDEEISENDELNNEATRAIVVGEAANLMWANFETDDVAPALTDTILVFGYVKNNGDVATDGDVVMSYIDNNFDTIQFGLIQLGIINPGDSALATLGWNVIDNKTTLIGEIVNSTELEFTYNDNMATTQIGKFNVALSAVDVCFGSNGSLKATVTGNGVAPYTFLWNTGANTDSLVAVPGVYSVDVTDATGFTITEVGEIGVLSGGLNYLSNIHVCEGDSIEVFGTFQQTAGFYYDTLQTVGGCDSVLSRALIVDEIQNTVLPLMSLCGADSAMVLGEYRLVSGTYYDSLVSVETGCDSIVSRQLILNPAYEIILADVVGCDSAQVFGQFVSNSGTYRDTLETRAGCDSIIVVNVSINSSDNTSMTVAACNSYTWAANGTTYTSSDSYIAVLTNEDGCDSTVTLNLTINTSDTTTENIVACDSYTWAANGQTYLLSGEYTATLSNSFGCDSVVNLALIINSSQINNLPLISLCGEDSAMVLGSYRFASGIYTDTLVGENNCDSIVTRELILNPEYETILADVIACDSASVFGDYVFATGTYHDTLQSISGCDSVLTVNVSINNSNSGTETVVACNTYTWLANATVYTQSGQYSVVLSNSSGCDSTANLALTINTSDTTNQTMVSCNSYTWPANSVTYTTSGNYTVTLANTDGCDSVVNLALTINSSDTTNLVASSCDSYVWSTNGVTYTSGGNYQVILANAHGCDSIVSLALTIHNSDTTNQAITACNSYVWPTTGLTYTSSGNYSSTLSNADGCDSVVNLALTINNSDTTRLNVTACDSYTWFFDGGTPNIYSTSGVRSVTLLNAAGCDSVVILDLIVNYSETSSQTITACDSYVWPVSGLTYTSSGTYPVVLTNSTGCDSTITLNLTINTSDITNQAITACDSYLWPTTGLTYTITGNYTSTLTNGDGCDSVVNLALTINNSDTTRLNITACNSYTWFIGGGTPNVYSSSGTHSVTLLKADGCDSVVILDLIVNYDQTSSQSVSACNSYTWPVSGLSYTASGTYQEVLNTAAGCDSTVTLNLTISTNDTTNQTITSCDSYLWPTNGLLYTASGNYSSTLTNANGCDSVVNLFLTLNASDSVFVNATACDSYFWNLDGMTYSTSGIYSVLLTNSAGCDSTIVLDLTINNGFNGSETVTECKEYLWPFNGQLYNESGNYSDTLMAANGCDSIMSLNLTIDTIDTQVSLNGITLTALTPISTSQFQWVDCANGMTPIIGENNAVFTPTVNGVYAVVIQQGSCIDTSDCIVINNVGLFEEALLHSVNLYPNPTSTGQFYLDFGVHYDQVEISIKDVSGKVMEIHHLENVDSFEGDLQGAKGIYFIDIYVKDVGYLVRKLVKQ